MNIPYQLPRAGVFGCIAVFWFGGGRGCEGCFVVEAIQVGAGVAEGRGPAVGLDV